MTEHRAVQVSVFISFRVFILVINSNLIEVVQFGRIFSTMCQYPFVLTTLEEQKKKTEEK